MGVTSGVVVMADAPGMDPVDPVTALSAVCRSINLIACDCGRVEIEVWNSSGRIDGHPLADILNGSASSLQSGFEFRRLMTATALEWGNALALIRRDWSGAIVALEPLPHGFAVQANGEDGIMYRVGGQPLSPDQVLHVGCYPDPLRPLWFRSPLLQCPGALRSCSELQSVASALARTGTVGKVAITSPHGLNDEAVEAVRSFWATIHATPDGASNPLVLRNGMTAQSLTSSGAQDWLVKSREFAIAEVSRAFGVPVEMLSGGGSMSQVDAARAYQQGGLGIMLEAWANELTYKACVPGERVVINADWISDGSLKDSSTALTKLVMQGVITPNEARARLGYPKSAQVEADRLIVTMPGGNAASVGMSSGNSLQSDGDSSNA